MIGYARLLVAILLGCSLSRTSFAKLPDGITGCSISLSRNEFNQCVVDKVREMTPHMMKGIPGMRLPALDPFVLPSLSIDRSLDQLVIKTNITNIQATGASNYAINEIDVDPRALTLGMKIHMPFVQVRGNYEVRGRLLLLVLNGVGAFKGNFSNIDVLVRAKGKEAVDKSGVTRVEVDKLQLKIRVGHGNIRLKSPPQHAVTADAAQAFFNANPRLVLDIASPIIEDTAATISRALAVRALSSLTKDEILLK
ncbi:uncharacterized protein LOC106640774 [Copidosoma floridanum]|uniref:uncharacterized protein LOC106640774 n=1 Tax=Copidosoma floridanum TaxID=29053 RepID=UPI0006C9D039|nr:uncharacterized protein LOC106640774 [Copidosoma floridanum]